MASSSNAPPSASARFEDYEYLYVSNTNVSNFVSVKLSTDGRNYLFWKVQMLCLLDSHNMSALVDSTFFGPRDYSTTVTMKKYNSLVRGWIFGSVSEDVLADVYSLDSATDVWDKLKSKYDPTASLQQAAATKTDAQTQTEDIHADPGETNTAGSGQHSIDMEGYKDGVSTKTETKNEDVGKGNNKQGPKEKLREAVRKGDWDEVESILEKYKDQNLATEAIRDDGSTILHIAAGMPDDYYVWHLLRKYIKKDQLSNPRKDGSTALHIAAIVGNKDVAEHLVENDRGLLTIEDKEGKLPLRRALENMHLDVTAYLLDEMTAKDGIQKKKKKMTAKDGQETSSTDHPLSDVDIGVDLLANAISAGKYELALHLLEKFPRFASEKDDVLVAIAKTFPPELSRIESLLYPPTLNHMWGLIKLSVEGLLYALLSLPKEAFDAILYALESKEILRVIWIVICAPER